MVNPVIAGFGVATPGVLEQDHLWAKFFAHHTDGSARAERIFRNAGVETRHGVVDPAVEDVSQWSTAARMARYEVESLPLGESALREALRESGVSAADLSLLAVVSCTGYATPGLDIRLADRLGAGIATQRLFIGHMGCYAAVPGLAAVANQVRVTGRPAALLCVELTSLHLAPGPLDTEQTVAHALFSDAAAAVVVVPEPARGLAVLDVASRTDTAHADAMTWHVTDRGFRMGLSSRVPLVLARHLPDTVSGLLRRHGLERDDVESWAIHPGGRRILDVARQSLALTEDRLAVSRDVLRRHGNCSSATILMILREMAAEARGELVACAFGPGLTLYSALLRAV
ncbi:putative naringenin-chalcone synthase [Stackebrandtia albiflava]|uniref:Putative naringenin-chalcone synthase n=1 Tax=Stackebrandtia albiflava TaxID=406432 RepID=A0A562V0Y4_9ACTN|nr:3-oxoacyl-[acyl-carrier-protein] synthase III C-terminal domain-containing protein [Stackebrandtia albiflava]TWJ11576.1 putative naringenin-chalcone synthase [Stackebrandtia albiflava]